MFHLVHDESAHERPEAVDGSQHVERELLIVFHVGGVYFQQIVVVARDVVALGDLGNSAHDARKFGGLSTVIFCVRV